MKHDVRLSAGAARDLTAIHRWISDNCSPDQADILLDTLIDRAATLASFPQRGATQPELEVLGVSEFRQLPLISYRIIYRVVDNAVFIMIIADGRRDMQALLEQRFLGS